VADESAASVRVLTLLTRSYCHLCDDMRAAVGPVAARHGFSIAEVDVDQHAALEAAYGERVPVLFLGAPGRGRELGWGSIAPARLDSALAELR
jgi:glutaredoxin